MENIIIEKDYRRMQYIIRIPRKDMQKAFNSHRDMDSLITNIISTIYDEKENYHETLS